MNSKIFLILFFIQTQLTCYIEVTLENKTCKTTQEAIDLCKKVENDPCEKGYYIKPRLAECSNEGKPICKCTMAKLY